MSIAVLMFLGSGPWRAQPRPPAVDLSAVDPKVAGVLRKHQEEILLHPRSGPAWGWLGGLYWTYDYRPQARECLERAERLDPANPRWPYYHGLALMIATPREALPKFRRAAQLCGIDPEAPRVRLARLLGEEGRWEEAQAELEPLLRVKPDFAPARLLSARAAQARSDLAGAVALARGCTDDPRTARSAWALLAILYQQQKDPQAAAKAAQRSLSAPADEGMGDPYEAEITLLRPDPRALSTQAHPLLASGHYSEAAALIDRLVREHPTYPGTWLLLGRLQLLRKDLSGAEKSLRHHLELSPQSTQGLFQMGLVLMAQNRFPEAAEVFGRATQLKADFGPAYYNRGVALTRSGQLQEAANAFQESLRHNPERFDSYLLLADLYRRLGEGEKAAQLLEQSEALSPGDPRLKSLGDQLQLRTR